MLPNTLNTLKQLEACCRDEIAFKRLLQLLDMDVARDSDASPPMSSGVNPAPKPVHYQLLLRVVARIRRSLDLDIIFSTTATEVRSLLRADRVAVFRFAPDSGWNLGEFVSEDVSPVYDSALAKPVKDECFGHDYASHYHEGRVQAVANIYSAGLQDCHIQVLAQFQIRANLIVPLFQANELWGLLCIHQCSVPREWHDWEIEFVRQVAHHFDVALTQAALLEQTRQQTQELAEMLNDLRQAQTQLIQTEKMSSLGQLVAGVAHEINNPVNFIYGNLMYVDEYAQDLLSLMRLYQKYHPEPVAEIEERLEEIELDFLLSDLPKTIRSMRTGAERIRDIVLSLRHFARIDEATMKRVDIHEGLDSTLLILQHRLTSHLPQPSIQVIKCYGILPPVECYAGQLNQVFMNVLANAIDALEDDKQRQNIPGTSKTPTIQIQTKRVDEQWVCIRIADNGVGIPENVRCHLFDPFYTTKPVGKGTGLGLSVCHQIVTEWHHGTIECWSQVGQGTEFLITLPVTQSVMID